MPGLAISNSLIPLRAGGKSYNPLTDIPNWQMYFDAQNNNYTTVTGAVDTWLDESGNSRTLTQSGGRPAVNNTGINGKRSFTFSGQSLQRATGFPTNSDFSVVVVHKPNATTPANTAFCGSVDNSLSNGNYFGWGNDHFYNTYIGGQNTTLSTGANSSKFINRGGKPRVDVYTYNNTTKAHDLWVNGVHVKSGSVSGGTYTNASFSVGMAFAFFNYAGEIGHVAVNSRVLTGAEIVAHSNYCISRWAFPAETMLIFDGDSLMVGAVGVAANSIPQKLLDLVADATSYFSLTAAIGATEITDFSTRAAAGDGMDQMNNPSNCNQRILIVWGGTNDVGNSGGDYTAAYNHLRSYLQGRKAAKTYDKIIVLTAIPRETTSFTNNLFSFNNLIRTNWTTLQSDGATHLVDLNTIAQFDADGDYNNATYYDADKTHLTDAGRALIAPLVKSSGELT